MTRITEIDDRLGELFDEHSKVTAEIAALRDERKQLRSAQIKAELGVNDFTDLTPEKYMAVRDWDEMDHATYLIFSRWMEQYTNKGVSLEGHRGNGQALLYVHFDSRKPLKDQLSILEFLPFMVPWKDDWDLNDCVRISILEHTCCEHFMYHIRIKDGKHQVIRSFSSIEHVECTFDNIMDCLQHVYRYHWLYSNPTSCDEETFTSQLG